MFPCRHQGISQCAVALYKSGYISSIIVDLVTQCCNFSIALWSNYSISSHSAPENLSSGESQLRPGLYYQLLKPSCSKAAPATLSGSFGYHCDPHQEFIDYIDSLLKVDEYDPIQWWGVCHLVTTSNFNQWLEFVYSTTRVNTQH